MTPSETLLTWINSIQGDQTFGACIIKLKPDIYTPNAKATALVRFEIINPIRWSDTLGRDW